MLLTQLNDAPKITDWITAVAAIIGVPLSAVAFFKLVRRDKDRQNQINKLTNIAWALENQTEVMIKQNELIAQQVDIFRNTNILKGNNEEAIIRLQEIEEARLRLSVQPRLWLNGAGYVGYSGEFDIDLNNKGEVAYLDDFNVLSGDIELHNKSVPFDLEKGSRRYIFGRAVGQRHIKDTSYEIEVLYHNALNQPYQAVIKGTGNKANITSDKAL